MRFYGCAKNRLIFTIHEFIFGMISVYCLSFVCDTALVYVFFFLNFYLNSTQYNRILSLRTINGFLIKTIKNTIRFPGTPEIYFFIEKKHISVYVARTLIIFLQFSFSLHSFTINFDEVRWLLCNPITFLCQDKNKVLFLLTCKIYFWNFILASNSWIRFSKELQPEMTSGNVTSE